MNTFDLDDVQFVGNTIAEAKEERRKVAAELARLQAIEAAARKVTKEWKEYHWEIKFEFGDLDEVIKALAAALNEVQP